MDNPAWIALIRKIPVEWHDCLALNLATGMEIVVQRVMRLDADYMIIHGRQTGTSDGGRLMVLPYDQLVNVAFNRRINDPVVQNMFGKFEYAAPVKTSAMPAADDAEETSPSQVGAPDLVEDAEPQEHVTGLTVSLRSAQLAMAQEAAAAPGPKPPQPSKSILLARLRERLAQHGHQQS